MKFSGNIYWPKCDVEAKLRDVVYHERAQDEF